MHRQQKLPDTQYGWWRFHRYQLQNGVIRPDPRSRLTWYDPWVDFLKIRNQTNGQPAYVELARLYSTLKAEPGANRPVPVFSEEGQSQILAWCGQHGLLGVLLSRWESVTLSARPAGRDPSLKIQERYFRGYGMTVCHSRAEGDLPEARSSVLLHPLDDFTLKEETLAQAWRPFFPSVPWPERESFPYPAPYSQGFWELYAEPIVEFWRAARIFAGILEHLMSAKPGAVRMTEGRKTLARAQAVEMLNVWRKDVSQVLFDEAQGLRQEWVSPSLLASFAEMFVQDLVAGRRAIYCVCCGHPFISEAYQAVYCSRACRLRQQKRNLRAHIKQARALFVRGQTIREISRSLEESPQLVQGWVCGLKRGRKMGPS